MYFVNIASNAWLLAVLFACCINMINGQMNIFMDSPTYCGNTFSLLERTYRVRARDDATPANPDYRCTIVINSGYEDPYYQIQITQRMVDINDCGVKLSIYEGSSPGGASVKSLSCTTKNTGVMFSKGGTITFELITPRVLYNPRNDFEIDVQAFRDPNAPSNGPRLQYIFMNNPEYCGKSFSLFNRTYSVHAREHLTPFNPGYSCAIVIDSGYEDPYYQIQINQKTMDINDCNVIFSIFVGSSLGGNILRSFSCASKKSGVIYYKGRTITFEVKIPNEVYNQNIDFVVEVSAFREKTSSGISCLQKFSHMSFVFLLLLELFLFLSL